MDSDDDLFEFVPDNNTVKSVTNTSNIANITSNISVSKKSKKIEKQDFCETILPLDG
ncbi:2314_t:CDS:2, partial [Cetraspora pellucida]